MTRIVLILMLLALQAASAMQQSSSSNADLIARAKSLELDTPYAPPPGDAAQHHASGYAKIMCSAVFVTGLDPDFAAENVGYFTAPYDVRRMLGKPIVDREAKLVHVTMPNGIRRTAKYLGKLGCVTLPLGSHALGFTPIEPKSTLPDPDTQPWPMGDLPPKDRMAPGLDMEKMQRAIDAAFDPPTGMTAAFVVTWRGRIVGER
jgi:hypothetical protein